MFISGYANKENIFYCLHIPVCMYVNYSVERGEHEPSKLLNNTVRSVKDEHDELKAITRREGLLKRNAQSS